MILQSVFTHKCFEISLDSYEVVITDITGQPLYNTSYNTSDCDHFAGVLDLHADKCSPFFFHVRQLIHLDQVIQLEKLTKSNKLEMYALVLKLEVCKILNVISISLY